MKNLTGMANRKIGQLFGGLSYFAEAKIHQRLSMKLSRDRSLNEGIE